MTLTCKTKGINGNDIMMSLNYFGRIGGEELPPGLVSTFSGSGELPRRPCSVGSQAVGHSHYDDAITNLGEREFEYVALSRTPTAPRCWHGQPNTVSPTPAAGAGCASSTGHLFTAKRDSYADHIIWGATRNSGLTSVLAIESMAPTPVYELGRGDAAKAARALTNDPV